MKRYLLVFWLETPRAEHAIVKSAIDQWASGTPQIAFTNANRRDASLIGWLAISSRPLADLHFDGGLFGEDRYFAVEIGSETAGDGFRDVQRWLWETRPR